MPTRKVSFKGKKKQAKRMSADEWKEYRDEQKQRRQERLPVRQREIEKLSELGYSVVKLTEYQFRVNGAIDLYPIHRRYHILKSGSRGTYKIGP